MNQDLSNVVAVVTGSSRGIGRGIAVGLGSHGATVYVTGRTAKAGQSEWPGSLEEAAAAVTEAGGKGIPVVCDFGNDEQIKQLFEKVEKEQGKLHILVNNAAHIIREAYSPGDFWEKPLELVGIIDVGLRSSYVASYYAAPLLLKSGHGLIMNTSSYGGVSYIHGPAYGMQKAGTDKMAADMAVDFRDKNVACASFWFGPVTTERFLIEVEKLDGYEEGAFSVTETPEFGGHVLAAMYNDPKLMEKSGNTFIVAELAQEYGIKDANGVEPLSFREAMGEPRIPHPSVIR